MNTSFNVYQHLSTQKALTKVSRAIKVLLNGVDKGVHLRFVYRLWGRLSATNIILSVYTIIACHGNVTSPAAGKQVDVMSMRRFPHYWPLAREIHPSPMDSPHKEPVMRTFDVSFDISMNNLLNEESSCLWFDTPWHPRDATVTFSALYRTILKLRMMQQCW